MLIFQRHTFPKQVSDTIDDIFEVSGPDQARNLGNLRAKSEISGGDANNHSFEDHQGLQHSHSCIKCENDLYSKKVNLNHFDILKVVGRGSFGKVFLVKKLSNGIHYAMKSIRKDSFKTNRDKQN